MAKKGLVLLTMFMSIVIFSQIKYEKAYFITNSGNRVECYIKNIDWRNSPNTFEYKINEADKNSNINGIKEVKLFEIYDQAKYIRTSVKIDKSSNDINKLSKVREPEFVEREVFLKELFSGNVRLYKFAEENSNRYFYQTDNGEIKQLVYKPYELESDKMAYNNEFRKQLESVLKCASINEQEIRKLQYNERDLTNLFNKYYKCSDSKYEDKLTHTKKSKFNLNIRPRFNFSSLDFSNGINQTEYKMDSYGSFGLGLELEYLLPFNKNKWAIIVEPTYQYYKSNKTFTANYLVGGQIISDVDYKSIELPLGIRHYMYINDDSKISISAQYVIDFPMNSKIEFKRNDNSDFSSFNIKSLTNYVIGVGYKYKNKYGIEARFFTNREITKDYLFWQSKYKNISLVLSYNLF